MKPIKRKYSIGLPSTFKQLFDNYLIHNNCSEFFEIGNYWSRVDLLLKSGGTTILVEVKSRDESMTKWFNDAAMIQRDKYDKLCSLAFDFNSPAMYVVEFKEAFFIYTINQDCKSHSWESKDCPVESFDNKQEARYIKKEVTYLKYADAIVVSKKDWRRKSVEELNNYLKIKREEYYGPIK